VRRSRRSWVDAVVVAAAAGTGIAAEWRLYAWHDVSAWLPDLACGWALIGSGLVVRRRPGLLLAASGFAWFAGNFVSSALLLHRAPLAQLVLAYPSGRAASRAARGAVVVAYATSIVGGTWAGDAAAFVLAATLVAAAAHAYATSLGVRRRRSAYALRAASLFAVLLASTAAANLVWSSMTERRAVLHVYEAGLVALAAFLVYGLRRRPWQRAGIVDLVVDLGETRLGDVRGALAHVLGDPTLEVAYPVGGRYVDGTGRPVALPPSDGRRHATRIERDGTEVAVLLHDTAIRDDPALLDALAVSARLAATNARLQAEVQAQVAELEASRRRLVQAGDSERRRLEEDLQRGAIARLAQLDTRLSGALATVGGETAAHLQLAHEQLDRASAELRELAAGLHPHHLIEDGLEAALRALAASSPIPVEVTVAAVRLPDETEVTIYFACSEALANVWKHAGASRARVTVRRDAAVVRVEIRDDGVGGADPRSLADRVDAVGGRLTVDSPRDGGTRLLVELPLEVGGRAEPLPRPG
jgi:signal transduction histidine kinase